MPRFRSAYPPEFRRQMVELVRFGRTPEELAREFEPTAQSIAHWVRQPISSVERRRTQSGKQNSDYEWVRRSDNGAVMKGSYWRISPGTAGRVP